MDKNKLKQAQSVFLAVYPRGFDDPEMQAIGKKHKMDKHVAFAQYSFSPEAFADTKAVAEDMIRLVTRSSMVSVFEKPKFRDMVSAMDNEERAELTQSLYALLHGNEADGFHHMLAVLIRYGLAKWTLISVWRCYYYPETDLLYKPTTVKKVISHFALAGLVYKPQPNYDFFVRYRQAIHAMRNEVHPSLSPSLAAFSGFLMMAMEM